MKISTLGTTLSYGVASTPGAKPSTFTLLDQCYEIGDYSPESETIDVSDLCSLVDEFVAGRASAGGSIAINFRRDPEKSIPQLEKLFSDSKTGKLANKETWLQIIYPGMDRAFFFQADFGDVIPFPGATMNESANLSISATVRKYVGLDAKVTPVANTAKASS